MTQSKLRKQWNKKLKKLNNYQYNIITLTFVKYNLKNKFDFFFLAKYYYLKIFGKNIDYLKILSNKMIC